MNYTECPTCGGLPIDMINGVCNACRMEGATYRPTNTDRLVDAMHNSRFGPLAQVFVMEAVLRYAEQMAEATPEQLTPEDPEPTPDGQLRINLGVHPQAWIGVAKEIAAKLNDQHPTCGPCGLNL